MKVVIRSSPPLMIVRGSRGGVLRRALTAGLAGCALVAACRCAVLLAASIGGSAPAAGTISTRWHLWLAAALLSAAGASVSWGVAQRPRKRE